MGDAVPAGSPCCKANIEPTECDVCKGRGRIRDSNFYIKCETCRGRKYVAKCAQCHGTLGQVDV